MRNSTIITDGNNNIMKQEMFSWCLYEISFGVNVGQSEMYESMDKVVICYIAKLRVLHINDKA